MLRTTARLLGLTLMAAVAGCGSEGTDVGTRSSAQTVDNGIQLNGIQLNGIQLNGIQLNGIQLNGIQLNGIQLNGIQLNGIQLNGTELTGVGTNGGQVSGLDFVGAKLNGVLSNGMTLQLTIDAITPAPSPNDDVMLYSISFASDAGRQQLCGGELAIPTTGVYNLGEGVPGGGSWNSSSSLFTFSCQHAAIAKCVFAGYKPWMRTYKPGQGKGDDSLASTKHTIDMRDYHTACTRMIRADYCGNGSSFTANNRAINVYDKLGIQSDTETWSFEAEWDPNGALCISHTRLSQLGGLPSCFVPQIKNHCGKTSHFKSQDTLMMNEFNSRQ